LHQASALVRGSCEIEREEARQRVFLPVSPAAAAILKTRTPTNLYNDAEAARRLDELREAWLNPPELVRCEPEVVPGFPDRILPRQSGPATTRRRNPACRRSSASAFRTRIRPYSPVSAPVRRGDRKGP
jgi:hypothetical protein